MFRKPLDLLFVTLLLLPAACSGGGGGGGGVLPEAELFPDFLAEDFDFLDTGRWRVERDADVTSPLLENGRLRFRWDGAGFGSKARLVLRREGVYDAAALDVPILDSSVEARLTIDVEASGQPRRASIELRGGFERFVEAAVRDENGQEIERETTRLSRLDVPPGASDERIRFEVDAAAGMIRFFFANELIFAYTEPGLSVHETSRVAIEVEARDTQDTTIERFEPAQLSQVPERRVTDVRANHAIPSRVQWLFKLRDAAGDVLLLDPEQAEDLVPRVFEHGVPIDDTETCPVIRTFDALPLKVVIVLDHTLSMEAFGGVERMKESAKTLLDTITDSHEFSIWEFHDNQEDGSQRLPVPGGTREDGKRVIDEYDPDLRGFSLCWDTVEEALEEEFPEDDFEAQLRVLVFFSDGVDTSSQATPEDLIEEAQDRGVILYSLGYGLLTLDSRTNLLDLSTGTNGIFVEAPTPEEILPEFEGLNTELLGYLQLAYVTGRFLDPRIESLVDLDDEGRRVQQFVRGFVDGRELAFNDSNDQYNLQAGVLGVVGPLAQEEGASLPSRPWSARSTCPD